MSVLLDYIRSIITVTILIELSTTSNSSSVAKFCLIPHGKANREMLFISMSNVKTTLRNSLSDKSLLNILQVEHNCSQSVEVFTPSKDVVMLAKRAT